MCYDVRHWTIQHNLQGKDLANRVVTVIRNTASELGLSELVDVALKEVTDDKWE